jgi:hypothetical protein
MPRRDSLVQGLFPCPSTPRARVRPGAPCTKGCSPMPTRRKAPTGPVFLLLRRWNP